MLRYVAYELQLCLEVGRVLDSVAYMCYNYVWRLEECLVLWLT